MQIETESRNPLQRESVEMNEESAVSGLRIPRTSFCPGAETGPARAARTGRATSWDDGAHGIRGVDAG